MIVSWCFNSEKVSDEKKINSNAIDQSKNKLVAKPWWNVNCTHQSTEWRTIKKNFNICSSNPKEKLKTLNLKKYEKT